MATAGRAAGCEWVSGRAVGASALGCHSLQEAVSPLASHALPGVA